MNKIVKIAIPCALLFCSSIALAEKQEDPCPSNLVNLWKNYASNTENYAAIPAFLLENECLRSLVSTDFYTAMVGRIDHPEVAKYVDDLYAQLDWEKTVVTQQ
jgi:hypothetical protein